MLRHRGALFLDELAEFPLAALEALREPLEEGRVTIARAGASATYPARTILIGAMNPCRFAPASLLPVAHGLCRTSRHDSSVDEDAIETQ